MEYLKLIGIVIIVLGFALKFDVLATVLLAGLVTGIVAGMDIPHILSILGESFVSNRLMSIFLIIFPVIAIIERYGLKERAAYLIAKIKNASAGKVLAIYMLVRTAASAFNVRIGGHVQFVRPLILPMSEAAAKVSKQSDLSENEVEELKGHAAAVENFGNFFAQNCFAAASGVVLIQGTLSMYKEVTLPSIAMASIPVMVITVVFTFLQVFLFDSKVKKAGARHD